MRYLTEILELPVVDSSGKKIGKVDEVVAAPAVRPPRVAMLLLKSGKHQAQKAVPFEHVSALSSDAIRLRIAGDEVQPFRPDDGLLYLRKDLLDQQIIDVNGKKVVRVNDLSLEERTVESRPELRLHAVDIGLGGAARRLLSGVVPRPWVRKLETRLKQTVISWDFVNLLEDDPLRRVKLNISHNVLGKLHPAEIADIVEELSPKERREIFQDLDDTTAADALSEVEPRLQASILESLDTARAADILEEMEPDAAADVLAELPEETSNELLRDLPEEDAEDLNELLEFEEDSAGGLMTTDHLTFQYDTTVEAVRNFLGNLPERPVNLTTIFLLDETERYVGSVPVARLIVATGQQQLVELKNERRLTIPVESTEQEAIEMMDKYNLLALPVLEEDERLAGVITVDDIVSVLCRKD